MRIYYIDESEGLRYYVRTALGVDAERWNELHARVLDWRLKLKERYAVPPDRELHACDLLAGRGKLARVGNTDRRLSPEHGAEIFVGGLQLVEEAATTIGGVEIVNVCLHKPDARGHERASLDRLLNRINTSVASANRHAFLIFDEGREDMVARLYRRLRSCNPVPSRYARSAGRDAPGRPCRGQGAAAHRPQRQRRRPRRRHTTGTPGRFTSPPTCSGGTTSTWPAPAWASPPSCRHKMQEKAAGRDGDATVVVDPHANMVGDLLRHVPESLVDRVRLIDLADDRGAPGINLLDSRVFTDRDRTADSVVRIAKGLWDQWGPRMQSILEQTVKTLHEANERRDADEQYTILDGLRILSDTDFRADVLAEVSDPYPVERWGRDFFGWRHETRADALAPVQTRLSYYSSSKRVRAILGQPHSTIDMRRVIREGGIVFVSTAQGEAGRDVAALVDASLLNLVDAVIREQGNLPFEQRRGALVVVDEMQSMPGVDYESMLSELGKFGASFVLATQSLAKLDDLSRTMRDTFLANVGCLAVFQVAGNDARQLVWELGKERVTEDDITSLPVHQCYVRGCHRHAASRTPRTLRLPKRPGPVGCSIEGSGAAGLHLRPRRVVVVAVGGSHRLQQLLRSLPPGVLGQDGRHLYLAVEGDAGDLLLYLVRVVHPAVGLLPPVPEPAARRERGGIAAAHEQGLPGLPRLHPQVGGAGRRARRRPARPSSHRPSGGDGSGRCRRDRAAPTPASCGPSPGGPATNRVPGS